MARKRRYGIVRVSISENRLISPPDQDNPRGYFEHEQATRLHQDAAWIPQARGKAVKIVAHLLPFLPEGEQYRLIFMHRDMREAAASAASHVGEVGPEGRRIVGRAVDARVYAAAYAGAEVAAEARGNPVRWR